MEWISVENELPKDYTECLCYEDGNQWTCIYDGKQWVQPKEENLPTHWMKLPKPPTQVSSYMKNVKWDGWEEENKPSPRISLEREYHDKKSKESIMAEMVRQGDIQLSDLIKSMKKEK